MKPHQTNQQQTQPQHAQFTTAAELDRALGVKVLAPPKPKRNAR